MRRPSQMETFDALYCIAAGGGRGEALFGDSITLARPAYERTLIGNGYPTAYLEFPLLGDPGFDLLSVYGSVAAGARFAPGAGFGRQDLFDWFGSLQIDDGTVSCGLELDTSAGETDRVGVYLQQRQHTELVEPFLASIKEAGRARSYLDVLERMPKGWPPAYVGLFPGRPGTPLRIGGYMSKPDLRRCIADPAHLGKRFRRIGFAAFDEAMLRRCAASMRCVPSVDFQFDIMADGSLGDTFGLSLSFNQTTPRQAKACMEDGQGARLMEMFESWGLADDRWRLIADAAFARHVDVRRDDGSEGRMALCVLFNYAKIKFIDGVAQPAKFYFKLRAAELPCDGKEPSHDSQA